MPLIIKTSGSSYQLGSVSLINPGNVYGKANFVGYDSTITNGLYTIFKYSTSKTTNSAITLTNGIVPLHTFVVAGGGQGGMYNSGGGGAGGIIQTVLTSAIADTVNITVANISARNIGNQGGTFVTGAIGNNSIVSFTNQSGLIQTAIGGGGGGSYSINNAAGTPGGSGGGGGASNAASAGIGGNGTTGQGYSGGTGGNSSLGWIGGGGGGAGGVGSNATTSFCGAGGPGIQINTATLPAFASSIYANYYWGGGGGGGGIGGAQGLGGSGGGGVGGYWGLFSINQNSAPCINAPIFTSGGINTGGGGGGAEDGAQATDGVSLRTVGGVGGSGIVLIGVLTSLVN